MLSLRVRKHIIEEAIKILEGGFDGDDTLHDLPWQIDVGRFMHILRIRWGILLQAEWQKISSESNRDWTGLTVRGWTNL